MKTNPVGKSASVHTLTAKEAHASLPGLDTKALPEPSTGALLGALLQAIPFLSVLHSTQCAAQTVQMLSSILSLLLQKTWKLGLLHC